MPLSFQEAFELQPLPLSTENNEAQEIVSQRPLVDLQTVDTKSRPPDNDKAVVKDAAEPSPASQIENNWEEFVAENLPEQSDSPSPTHQKPPSVVVPPHPAAEIVGPPTPRKSPQPKSPKVYRYFSTRPAWVPGSDLVAKYGTLGFPQRKAAFGGCVYAQSMLAVEKALREDNPECDVEIHTVQGTFNKIGQADRPFIFEVSSTSMSQGRQFLRRLVTVRQPAKDPLPQTSTHTVSDAGSDSSKSSCSSSVRSHSPMVFTASDALQPLGPIVFSALVSYKNPAASFPSSPQTPQLQDTFPAEYAAIILASRRRFAWPPAPSLDIVAINSLFPVDSYASAVPAIETRKVDMRAFNSGRPLPERRELLLYRLISRLPKTASPSAHAAVHAFAADHNGLLMLTDNAAAAAAAAAAADGWTLQRKPVAAASLAAASLAAAFYVHCNVGDLVMEWGSAEDQWWVLEAMFPRAEAGRGALFTRVWSPRGVHVATGYQDGIVSFRRRDAKL